MAELPPDFHDETTLPQEQPLLVAEALAEMSGIPLSEFNGLTPEQLDALFYDPEIDENLFVDLSKTEEIKAKNAQVLRERIKLMRSA